MIRSGQLRFVEGVASDKLSMPAGVSKIRNPVIARVFRELKLIEQWGSGIPRIFRETAAGGFPEPYFVELGLRLRFDFPLTKPLKIDEEQPAPQSEERLESRLAAKVVLLLESQEAGKAGFSAGTRS